MAKLFKFIDIDNQFNPLNFESDSLSRTLFETNFFEGGIEGYIKVWMGSNWILKPIKYWNGSAWVQKPLKHWNGSAWVLTPAT